MKAEKSSFLCSQKMSFIFVGLFLNACADVQFKDGASSASPSQSVSGSVDRGPASDSGISPVGGDGSAVVIPPVSGGGPDTNPPGGVPPVGGDGKCVPKVADILRPTKILFLVDTTGSNAYKSDIYSGTTLIGQAEATDPTKSFRYNSISQFVKQHSMKQNFRWGLIHFSKTASNTGAQALINSGNNQSPLFSSADTALSALEVFKNNTRDEGDTHYTPLMALAAKAIQNDADFSKLDSQYFVLLVSDGMPNDPQATSYNSMRISELTGLAAGRIKVSSVFYTSLTMSPILDLTRTYLKDLVRRAQGIYAEVTGTSPGLSNFNFNDIIPGTPGDPNCPPIQ